MSKITGQDANIIIFCSDPRVVKLINNKIIRSTIGVGNNFSAIAETGSIKFFIHEGLMNKLFKQLDILIGHFNPEKIIILNHTDCGYYKSLGEDQDKLYLKDLNFAKGQISQKYPNIKIEGFLLDTGEETIKNKI